MSFFKATSFFFATMILAITISTGTATAAAFRIVGGQFDDGTTFSGAFQFNLSTGSLDDYNITTSRTQASGLNYIKSAEIRGNATSGINVFTNSFQLFFRTSAFPVGPRVLNQLFLDFAGSPTEFNGGQIISGKESTLFEPGAGCDFSLGTNPGGCGPFVRSISQGQVISTSEPKQVPEPETNAAYIAMLGLASLLILKPRQVTKCSKINKINNHCRHL